MPKLIVVSSPLAASKDRSRAEHVMHAKKLCRAIRFAGFIPFASHLYGPSFLDEDNPRERKLGIDINVEMIHRCDEHWIWDLWGISTGMNYDLVEANAVNDERKKHAERRACRCGAPAGKPCGHPEPVTVLRASSGLIKPWAKIIEGVVT